MRGQFWIAAGLSVGSLLAFSGQAQAEVTLAKPADGWEVYTSGRVGAFVEVIDGDPQPVAAPMGHAVSDGGINLGTNQDHQFASRVRSGFLGNILTLGVRRQLTESTTVTGQVSIWATSETDSERTFIQNFPDEREGYLKVEGPGGSLLVGRALSLFSRGGTEIDFLYGHGYAVGGPGGFNTLGPSGGHIGYGLLASVFVAGVAYATPNFHGLQLTAGYYDPGTWVGQYWQRTKLGRPEAELTYDAKLGGTNKLHVFANGAYQKLYSVGSDSTSVYGAGAGARLEVGPLHVGVSAFTGKGVGLNYFLNFNDSSLNANTDQLRTFDGGYVQTQLVVNQFDFNVGLGITRLHQLSADIDPQYFITGTTEPSESYLKSQMGVSAVVVYHFAPYLHGALDYFRSDAEWWLGEKQVLNSFNAGMTLTW